jgi:hypothetical protein
MSEFEADKAALLREMSDARSTFEGVVAALTPADLKRSRRGSWPVGKILDHVLHSERLYAQLISAISGAPSNVEVGQTPANSGEAIFALAVTREAVLGALGQVKEEDFYRLQAIGHEEYSVLSILENVAAHDREHAEQIRRTVSEE